MKRAELEKLAAVKVTTQMRRAALAGKRGTGLNELIDELLRKGLGGTP